jgi:hypothetical protein
MIEQAVRAATKNLDKVAPAKMPRSGPPKSPTAWRAAPTISTKNNDGAPMTFEPRPAPSAKIVVGALKARALKVVVPLDPGEVMGLVVLQNQSRMHLKISSDMGELRAEIPAKGVRRASVDKGARCRCSGGIFAGQAGARRDNRMSLGGTAQGAEGASDRVTTNDEERSAVEHERGSRGSV